MHHRTYQTWTLSLVTLLGLGCTLDAVEVGGGFRGADEEGADEEGASSGDESGDVDSSGDLPPEAPPPDEPPADEPPADEPPADEPPADEPPADEPPEPDVGPLHAALADCAFNLVWTTGPHYNQGLGLTKDLVAAQDDSSIQFQPTDNNAWIFPGVSGESTFSLEVLAIDAVTGVYTLGGQVAGPEVVLTLPPLMLDPNAPIVLEDATVQVPGSVGPAILTSLVDDSQQVDDSFRWGLVVSLNGGPNPACDPLLESVYGPF